MKEMGKNKETSTQKGGSYFRFLKGKRTLPRAVYTGFGIVAWMLQKTWRIQLIDPCGILTGENHNPIILTAWHNRLLFVPFMLPRQLRKRTAILASDSRDGEYAARYMRLFKFKILRGSSSKGGVRALIGLKKELENGFSVALTPDGPRGPKYQVQNGVVALSKMTGRPIVPFGFNATSRWELKGWDKTQIPKPFSRVVMILGDPIYIAQEKNNKWDESWNEQVRQAMLKITED